jgi:DNA-binding MarR family transcriptional regulator
MAELDPVIHQPVRLRIMAALASLREAESAEFTFLRDTLELTDGNLGAHVRKLEEEGYLVVEKAFVQRKPRTFIALSDRGRKAFQKHVAELQSILGKKR